MHLGQNIIKKIPWIWAIKAKITLHLGQNIIKKYPGYLGTYKQNLPSIWGKI
jgi:hypothetical protein